MAVSKERSDWALLLLRASVGGFAILHGLGPILHARGDATFANALRLGQGLRLRRIRNVWPLLSGIRLRSTASYSKPVHPKWICGVSASEAVVV